MLGDVGFDGTDQFRDAGKYAAAQTLGGEVAEEAFDHIQPRGRGGGEMHVETRVFLQPFLDLGVLVGGVVVADQMKRFVFGRFPIDLSQKTSAIRYGDDVVDSGR